LKRLDGVDTVELETEKKATRVATVKMKPGKTATKEKVEELLTKRFPVKEFKEAPAAKAEAAKPAEAPKADAPKKAEEPKKADAPKGDAPKGTN